MKNTLRHILGGLAAAAFAAVTVHAADLLPGTFSARYIVQDVTYKANGSGDYVPLTSGTILKQGAIIKTGGGSSVDIVFPTGAIASVRADTEIEISKFEQEAFTGPVPNDKTVDEPSVSNTKFVLLSGEVVSKVKKLKASSQYVVASPSGAAGVRGTIFSVVYNAAKKTLTVSTAKGVVDVISVADKGGEGGKTKPYDMRSFYIFQDGSVVDSANEDEAIIVSPDGHSKRSLEGSIKNLLLEIFERYDDRRGSGRRDSEKDDLIKTIEHSQIGVSCN